MQLLTDHFRMRDKATEVANMLARYVHRPLAPLPVREGEKALLEAERPKPAVELIPLNPKADEAFRRAALGLPPAPRTKL